MSNSNTYINKKNLNKYHISLFLEQNSQSHLCINVSFSMMRSRLAALLSQPCNTPNSDAYCHRRYLHGSLYMKFKHMLHAAPHLALHYPEFCYHLNLCINAFSHIFVSYHFSSPASSTMPGYFTRVNRIMSQICYLGQIPVLKMHLFICIFLTVALKGNGNDSLFTHVKIHGISCIQLSPIYQAPWCIASSTSILSSPSP